MGFPCGGQCEVAALSANDADRRPLARAALSPQQPGKDDPDHNDPARHNPGLDRLGARRGQEEAQPKQGGTVDGRGPAAAVTGELVGLTAPLPPIGADRIEWLCSLPQHLGAEESK
jgi:hypothetical protein